MINLGTSTMQDFALGDNLVERIDLGDTTIFDPYTTITGTLPLTFNSRAAVALKNYRIYGTSAGSGTPTESGEPAGYKIPILNTSGNLFTEEGSGLVQVADSGTQRFGKSLGKLPAGDYDLSYVRSGQINLFVTFKVNGGTYRASKDNPTAFTVLSTDDEVIIRTSYASDDTTWAELGFTDIVVNQQSNYDLFVGDSKLGEEEYADYGEQKVYKRTENLFDKDAKDTDKGYVARKYLGSDGSYQEGYSAWSISEYIDVEPSVKYQYRYNAGYNEIYLCLYDENKQFISSIKYGNFGYTISFTTTADTKFVRVSILNPKVNETQLIKSNSYHSTYIPYLQPTDPPAPLPAIQAYQDENTLSSTETLGEVTVKGRISASDSTP